MTQLLLPDIKGYSTEDLMEELRRRGIDVNLIEHHDKYLEIDGVDETRWVTHKQHREIHKQWRKEGRVIPIEICRSSAARISITKRKEYRKKYKSLPEVKERDRIRALWYDKATRETIYFTEKVGQHCSVREDIRFNPLNGKVHVYSVFLAHHGKKLYYLKE